MKKTLLLILILSWATACFGKMHIHTDASDYRAGERIWFRIHMLDARTLMPDTVTSLVIVELINPQGDVTRRAKLLRDNGVFCGYLDIPGTAEAGQYLVRSYLRGMSDMDYAGKQIVYVHGKRPTTLLWIPDVQSQVMSFSTDGHATIYDVVIEGVTSNGRLIREHQTIQSS